MPDRILTIGLTGDYPLERLDTLIAELDPLRALRLPTQLVMDLTRLTFIDAACLALLVASMKNADDRECVAPGSVYIRPDDEEVATYLGRMDFDRLLAEPGLSDPPVRQDAQGYRPCQSFATPEEIDDVSLSLTKAVVETCHPDLGAQAALSWALTEAARNVVQHAETGSGGIGAAQGSRTNEEFEVAIADCGIGIRASLAKNPQYDELGDDLEAIRLALAAGVTSNPDKIGGIGLFLMQFVLRENRGRMIIRSGEARIETGANEVQARGLPKFSGTLVVLRARIDQPLDLPEVTRVLEAQRQTKKKRRTRS